MKILIVHATAGAGHKKTAQAIYNHLKDQPGFHVVFADVLDYVGWFYKRTYRSGYVFLVTKWPWLWGFFFILTDFPLLRLMIRALRRILNSLNAGPFEDLLVKERFDCIISTHFFSNEVAASLKRTGAISSKIVSAITDFDVHSFWLAEGIDCYTVACEHTRDKLMTLGVPKEKIYTFGIPTDKKFSQKPDTGDRKSVV